MNLKNCPQCKAKASVREIIYGEPIYPVDESKFVIGGCLISDNDPTHTCIKCGWQRIEK